jgi:hypothetical protein
MRNLFTAKSKRSAAMALLAGAISLGAVASASADPGRRFEDRGPAHTSVLIETDHHWAARMPAPVRYERHARPYVSLSTQALRAAPHLASYRVGRLHAGERFQALARAGRGDWILVGQRGVALGYVFAGNVRPLDYRPLRPVHVDYDYREVLRDAVAPAGFDNRSGWPMMILIAEHPALAHVGCFAFADEVGERDRVT